VALLNDTASPENINFVFSASLPSTTQESTAASSTGLNWGGLHVVELGTDDIYMAADTTTNAVPLTISELYGIYVSGTISNWNQVGGTNAPIVPLVPPTGSSITNTFIKALNATVGSTATTITWDSAVQTVEQNDPTAITANASPTDAIAPFSQGRLNLWNAGYFFNPAAPYGSSNTATGNNGHGSPLPLSLASTPLSPGISLLSGSLPNGITGTTYKSAVTDYVIFRQDDATSTTPFQPGGTENWVQTLFSATPSSTVPTPPPPYFDTAAGRALIAAAGVTPSYDDLGLAA
jgi:hypothetical protein